MALGLGTLLLDAVPSVTSTTHATRFVIRTRNFSAVASVAGTFSLSQRREWFVLQWFSFSPITQPVFSLTLNRTLLPIGTSKNEALKNGGDAHDGYCVRHLC